MPPITDQQASVVALFVESVCYGIYLVTLGLSLRTLLWVKHGEGMKPWSQVNHLMLAVCLIMPITATINLALNVVRAVESVGPSGISEQFKDLGSDTEVTKFFCVNFQTLVADFMLTYRCWVIYNRSWLMAVVPSLLWFGVFSASTLNLVVLRQTHDESLTAAKALRPIITSFWATSIALNIFTTSLIVWRLYRAEKGLAVASLSRVSDSSRGRRGRDSWVSKVMRIIIESGVLYTSVAISTCITYVTGSQGVYVTSAIEMQTVGIAFNMIIIRVALADSTGYTQKTTKDTIPLQIVARQHTTDLEISVTKNTHTDHDELESTLARKRSETMTESNV